jgi:hypothetical protein
MARTTMRRKTARRKSTHPKAVRRTATRYWSTRVTKEGDAVDLHQSRRQEASRRPAATLQRAKTELRKQFGRE